MNESNAKLLTKNDTGETGGHQGGICVPRSNHALLSFFPELESKKFNPDTWLYCTDPDGQEWKMRYVYYNGKIFSPQQSTRNEYRITYMTGFFRKWEATAGDSVVFKATGQENQYQIFIEKDAKDLSTEDLAPNPKVVVLKGWRHVY
ncbi:MAG: hypothetical protein OFPI_00850 [Osedax symbiont Rs2]|nr:MAG: hypothetical protein OFPI_00850 [Osedax symbiont Rs2]